MRLGVGQKPGNVTHTSGECTLAFAGVYLFTLVLYARPAELFPGIFGSLPLVKTIALITSLVYILSKLGRGKRLMIWTLELKMAALIGALGILLAPIAASPQDSFNLIFQVYIKLLIVFALLINLTDTRARLRSLIVLVLICCSWLALDTINTFLADGFSHPLGGVRRNEALETGLFSNPNDRAIIFSMLLPLAVALGLIRRSLVSLLFFGLASLFAVGVISSHSRAGLLSLIATAAFQIWKIGRRKRWVVWVAGGLLIAFIALATMGSLGERFFNPNKDKIASAEERKKVLKRAVILSIRHSVIGLGIGNFHIYSFKELKAHNSYLEIAAELGFIGLLAYLIMLITPIRSLIRIEGRSYDLKEKSAREIYYLSIGLQGTFLAYLICSFFGSIQYDWYIYHPIVFAIALRRITQFEAQSAGESFGSKPAVGAAPKQGQIWGTLWRPHPGGRLSQTGEISQFEAQSAGESFDTKIAVRTAPEQGQILGTLWRPHPGGRLFQTGPITQFEAKSAGESFDTKLAIGAAPEQGQQSRGRGILWRQHRVSRPLDTGASNTER